MGYKMKGYSYPGKSPLKQDKKEFKGINWDTLDNVTVDGKTPKEIKKENLQKERDKWNQDLIDLRLRYDKPKKKSPLKQKGHSKGTYNTSVKEHAKENPYWYKVNNKRVSKYVYNKYKNKPGSDEPGKQTNDPDASGNKAKIAKDRASNKASRRPTVLTEAQTKVNKK